MQQGFSHWYWYIALLSLFFVVDCKKFVEESSNATLIEIFDELWAMHPSQMRLVINTTLIAVPFICILLSFIQLILIFTFCYPDNYYRSQKAINVELEAMAPSTESLSEDAVKDNGNRPREQRIRRTKSKVKNRKKDSIDSVV